MYFAPPAGTPPGSYTYSINFCSGYMDWLEEEGEDSCTVDGTVEVDAPLPPVTFTLQPATLNLSTGDTNKVLTTTAMPSTVMYSPIFSSALTPNPPPHTTCAATLVFGSSAGMGTFNTSITSPANQGSPGGIFGVYATAGTSTNSVTVIVPPQVMIQTLFGEAQGQTAPSDQTMASVLAVAANRFGDRAFGNPTTWQAVLTIDQFYGADSNAMGGVEPELPIAAAAFAGSLVNVLNCEAYWSPYDYQFTALSGLNGQYGQSSAVSDSVWDSVGAPSEWRGQNKQAVIKQSVANNVVKGKTHAPAIVLFRLAQSPSDPAVITIQ